MPIVSYKREDPEPFRFGPYAGERARFADGDCAFQGDKPHNGPSVFFPESPGEKALFVPFIYPEPEAGSPGFLAYPWDDPAHQGRGIFLPFYLSPWQFFQKGEAFGHTAAVAAMESVREAGEPEPDWFPFTPGTEICPKLESLARDWAEENPDRETGKQVNASPDPDLADGLFWAGFAQSVTATFRLTYGRK